jgi:hypothetical protein
MNLDAVARALLEHVELQRILARRPLSVNTWGDGDVLNDWTVSKNAAAAFTSSLVVRSAIDPNVPATAAWHG